MKKQLLSFTLLAAGFLIGATALSALADTGNTWTPPSATPPGGNVAAPINVGSVAQAKTGLLTLGNFQFDPGGASNITPGWVLTATNGNGAVAWAQAGSSGVTSIIAGKNISVSPSGGTGNVTINTPTPTATVNIGSGVWTSFADINNSISCPPNEIQIGYSQNPSPENSQTVTQTEIECATITVSMTN